MPGTDLAEPGRWSRRQARSRHLAFVAQRRRHYLLVALVIGLPSAVIVAFSDDPRVSYVVGAMNASVVWMIAMAVVTATGTSPQMMGAEAAEWTADCLRKLKRKGWQLVHEFPLRWGDVDHVAVGPGGVVAIETKWSSRAWTGADDERIAAAAAQAREGARQIRLRLRSYYRPLTVTPLVVLWSPDASVVPTTRPDDVAVVLGEDLRAWIDRLPQGILEPTEVSEAIGALRRYGVSIRTDEVGRYIEGGMSPVASDVAIGVSAGIGTFLLGSLIWTVIPFPFSGAATLAFVAGSISLRFKGKRWRTAWLGALCGAGAFSALVAAIFGWFYLERWIG